MPVAIGLEREEPPRVAGRGEDVVHELDDVVERADVERMLAAIGELDVEGDDRLAVAALGGRALGAPPELAGQSRAGLTR